MRLLGVCVLSVVMMIVGHRYQDTLVPFRDKLSMVMYPIQWIADAPSSWAVDAQAYFYRHDSLVQENARLRMQQLELDGRLQRLQALEAENVRLRALLKSSPRDKASFLVSEILRIDPDLFTHQVILDKGSRFGVYIGQPVIDAEGIMGEVISVTPVSARAMLITDASHAIPVENSRNGIRAIAIGSGAMDRLELQHVPNTADLKVGDLLVTSGLGGRYPTGYPVGTITRIDHDPGLPFARVLLKPSAQLDRSRQVLLIQIQEDDVP